jgi:hypothetical protein
MVLRTGFRNKDRKLISLVFFLLVENPDRTCDNQAA